MSKIIEVELDDETNDLRTALKNRLGWTDTRIVREAIKALASVTPTSGRRNLTGVGEYDSGLGDLATNPEYLEGLGQ